jgi:hypothetical protein
MPYEANQIEAIIAAAEGWERTLVTLYFFTARGACSHLGQGLPRS